jgi:hypothetical protein
MVQTPQSEVTMAPHNGRSMNRSCEAWLEHEHIHGCQVVREAVRWYGAITNRPLCSEILLHQLFSTPACPQHRLLRMGGI